MYVVEDPDSIVTAAQIRCQLLRRFVVALPLDQALLSAVIYLPKVYNPLKPLFYSFNVVVSIYNNPPSVSPNVRVSLVLAFDASSLVQPYHRHVEGVEDLYICR